MTEYLIQAERMVDQGLSVVEPLSLQDWSLPATSYGDFGSKDGTGRYLEIREATTLRCPPPILSDRMSDQSLFFPHGNLRESYEIPLAAVRMDMIPQAQLIGEKFVVVSRDRKVFSESYWSDQNLNDRLNFAQQPSAIIVPPATRMRPTTLFRDRVPVRRLEGPAMLLGNPWSFNYHHWVINCLSRLWWTDRFPELQDVPVIVPSRLAPFHRQSLDAMGVNADRIIPFDGGPWLVGRLYFPANGDFWPAQLRWIRRRLFEHFGIAETDGKRLLYISRADAPNRRIVNERDVAARLAKLGFETFQLSTMPLRDQIQAFAEARIVIGPHGSGLTNVLFGAPNLNLIELHPYDQVNHVFWVLASAMEMRYAFFSGKSVNAERDFEIDLADLDKMVSKFV